MVSRKQKLIAAGAVLAVGLGLALLFPQRDKPASAPATALAAAVVPTPASHAKAAPLALDAQFSPSPAVPATSAGLVVASAPTPLGSPAAHPAATPAPAPPPVATSEVSIGRPVYAPADDPLHASPATDSGYRVHVVHNGDTLERLAERYLSDGARALELFDVNRDVLENPHLLPIGVELRIPGVAKNAD